MTFFNEISVQISIFIDTSSHFSLGPATPPLIFPRPADPSPNFLPGWGTSFPPQSPPRVKVWYPIFNGPQIMNAYFPRMNAPVRPIDNAPLSTAARNQENVQVQSVQPSKASDAPDTRNLRASRTPVGLYDTVQKAACDRPGLCALPLPLHLPPSE